MKNKIICKNFTQIESATLISTSPLSNPVWHSVLLETYGVKLCILKAISDKKEVGTVLYYTTKNLTGVKVIRSLKNGLVADNDNVAQKMILELEKIAKKQNVTELHLSCGQQSYDIETPTTCKTTLLFNINGNVEELWTGLRAKTRNSVRKAEKDGISVDRGEKYLPEFYKGYSERLLEKGVSFHSIHFFENLFKSFQQGSELIVAKYDGNVIGSIILLYDGDKAIYGYNGTNIHKPVSPNQLLLWEGVKSCVARGCSVLDLSESSEGSGVYNFKKNFGGVPTPVYYFNKQLKTSSKGLFYRIRNKIVKTLYPMLTKKWQIKISCWKRKFEVLQ